MVQGLAGISSETSLLYPTDAIAMSGLHVRAYVSNFCYAPRRLTLVGDASGGKSRYLELIQSCFLVSELGLLKALKAEK